MELNPLAKRIAQRLRELFGIFPFSPADVARICDLPLKDVEDFVGEQREPKFWELAKIAEKLYFSLDRLYSNEPIQQIEMIDVICKHETEKRKVFSEEYDKVNSYMNGGDGV